ncbi:MAG TPA: hypothetical protein DIT04_10790 [Dysgonomonas sp.]|nr:hypothetical protein [Dysgonomonas sp.]
MKNLLLLGLLFASASLFAQQSAKNDSARVQFEFRSLSGDTQVVYEMPDREQVIAEAEKPVEDALSAERPPSTSSSMSTNAAALESIDRLMGELISQLPPDQRQTIRKSNGQAYNMIPLGSADGNGKAKIKSRKILYVMPAGTRAPELSTKEAREQGIPIEYYYLYGSN